MPTRTSSKAGALDDIDSDSDEEYQAQVRARLAAKLGQKPKKEDMWQELQRHLAKVCM